MTFSGRLEPTSRLLAAKEIGHSRGQQQDLGWREQAAGRRPCASCRHELRPHPRPSHCPRQIRSGDRRRRASPPQHQGRVIRAARCQTPMRCVSSRAAVHRPRSQISPLVLVITCAHGRQATAGLLEHAPQPGRGRRRRTAWWPIHAERQYG